MSSKFLWVPPSSGTRHTGTRQEGNLTTQGTRGELAQKCRGLRRPRSNVRFVWHARPILFPTASRLLRQMHVMKLHTWPAMLVRQQATARLGTSTSRKPRGKLGNAEHWMLSVWLSDIGLHIPNSKVCKRIVGCVMCKYKLAQLHCLPLDLYILPGIH